MNVKKNLLGALFITSLTMCWRSYTDAAYSKHDERLPKHGARLELLFTRIFGKTITILYMSNLTHTAKLPGEAGPEWTSVIERMYSNVSHVLHQTPTASFLKNILSLYYGGHLGTETTSNEYKCDPSPAREQIAEHCRVNIKFVSTAV